MPFALSGLSSGIDTRSIVDQLMSIESRPKVKLDWSRQLSIVRRDAWSDLKTRLGSLKLAADALLSYDNWLTPPASGGGGSGTGGPWGVTSGASSIVSATVSGSPSAATYNLAVTQLAQGEISVSTGALAAATSGIRQTGIFYKNGGTAVSGTENLTALRTNPGNQNTGLGTGSKITMDYTVNGVAQSAVFTLGTGAGQNGTRLSDLRNWVETTIGSGATASWSGGRLRVETAPGTANELTALQFTAKNSSGTTLTRFNALAGATSSTLTAASDGGASGAQTLTIAQGSNSWNIALEAGDQIGDIASKINAVSGIGVTASVVGGALELRSTTIGAASAFTVTSSGNVATLLNIQETQAASDAAFTVDGVAHTSATNTNITGVIPNLTLSLTGTGSTTLTVEQGPEPPPDGDGSGTGAPSPHDALVNKMKAFVNAYNAVLDFVHAKTTEAKVTTPADREAGFSLGEYLQGAMARNPQLGSVVSQLKTAAGDAVLGLAAGSNTLADIGIKSAFSIGSTGAKGKLELDEAALRASLAADPARVQGIVAQVGMGGGVSADDGIVRRISELASSMTAITGVVGGAIESANSNVRRLQDSIGQAQRRLDVRRQYYERMFASLETNLGRMRNQGSWLMGQLGQLQR